MKKGQAAMEFLMTYGWAILVVLAAIGALAYFGVLSPDNFLPEKCTGPAGLDCLDKASVDSTADTVSFALKNNLGSKINLTNIAPSSADSKDCGNFLNTNVSIGGGTYTVINTTNGTLINNGEQFVVKVTCTGFTSGRFAQDFSLTYLSIDTNLVHKAAVIVRGKAVN